MMLALILTITHAIISGCLALESESGWLDTIKNHLPIWSNNLEDHDMTTSHDNDLEDEYSIKLIELLPQLKVQLESSNEEEKLRAIEFIEKMKQQIEENKRYTTILWKGVKRTIDMGRLQSTERRFIGGTLRFFVLVYLEIATKIYCWFADCKPSKSKVTAVSLEVFDKDGNPYSGAEDPEYQKQREDKDETSKSKRRNNSS